MIRLDHPLFLRHFVVISGIQSRSDLKDELQRELNLPRRERGANRAIAATCGWSAVHDANIGCVTIGRLKVRSIEKIERLHAEFELRAFAPDRERFVQSQISLEKVRPARDVASGVAEKHFTSG